MSNYKKTRRNLRSKRQKGRSLKQRNRKSRKVMRGGGDPLKDVKQNNLVSVVLKDKTRYNFGRDKPKDDSTIICQVVSVENTGSPEQKIVKLRITNEDIKFGYVYGGNPQNGIPVEFSDNFDIIYSPSYLSTNPYYFRIYKRDDSSNLQVIPYRYYTHIKENNDSKANLITSWVIKSVELIKAIKSAHLITASQ